MAVAKLSGSRKLLLDPQSLDYMIDHVFLPPRLPQEDDTDAQHSRATIQVLCDSVSRFLLAESASLPAVQPVLKMLERFLKVGRGLGLNEAPETQMLRDTVAPLKDGDFALFHLRCQNAGLLLTARQDDILFEAFELLAPNEDVMSCEGALLREFPDRAAAVELDKLQDDDFLDELVDVIKKLDVGIAPMARPKVTKAGTVQPEERDSLSPVLATGMLIDVLVGLGQSVDPDRIAKRSREQVGWNDARLPFHRSPTWLLLRVALRLVLDRGAASGGEQSWYKPLMAYHHARILSIAAQATTPPIPSDKLSAMTAKLARRITKINPAEQTGWVREVRAIVAQSQAVLRNRWKEAQDGDIKVLPLDELANLSFHQDSELKIQNLRRHLSWIESRSTAQRDSMGPGDTTHFDSLRHSEPPALSNTAPKDAIMDRPQLLDFETWAKFALPRWSDAQLGIDAEPAVVKLQELIDEYHKRACAAYEGVPAALSIMYLVVMELWVAMDKIAGKAIPLLLNYDPGFPLDAFCPLLLERHEDMARLQNLEEYLSHRRREAPTPYESAFSGFGREKSFAVQFYRTSTTHQALREKIETEGAAMKAKKLQEFKEMRARHKSLNARRNDLSCDTYWNTRWQERQHSNSCTRCKLDHEMASLRITVFEWPLPTHSSHADAAVVEIRIPRLVKVWRNVTWTLVTEVFRETAERYRKSNGSIYYAGNHSGLRSLAHASSRLQPASTIKPMEVAHYREKHILEATPENICVPHAAQYEYYDEPLNVLAINNVRDVRIPPHCSYAELVKGLPVPDAENWIRYATHASNDVIAGQSYCPLDTTLEEFRAFGNLRSGVTLQWANILCQLKMPSVDLNKKPTFALILQACLEAGPAAGGLEGVGTIWREAHNDTQNATFLNRILQALDEALERVRESWQNGIALCLLACLATRLLFLSPSADISTRLLGFLSQVREISIGWARQLLDKLNHSEVDRERQEWAQRVLKAALICAVTFDVGEVHLAATLNDSRDLAVFVESAVLARNHLPASERPSDSIALQLVHRWHTVMYQAREAVVEEVLNNGNTGLDGAIEQIWAGYSPPAAQWMRRTLDAQRHVIERRGSMLSVSFNVLTGNLFVNGHPLSKLPRAYQQNSTFKQLFGEQILDVGPSSVPEMEFSACREQNGWVIHFAMKEDQLVVRAVRSSGTWEYIPRRHLDGDLPNSFVNKYAHWLNLATKEIEFRALEHNSTAGLAHRILGSIESFWDMDPIFDSDAMSLVLELPRLCLSFSVLEGESTVRSKNYTNMRIDQDQGIGSLIGLSDRLVLKPESGLGFRSILIPRGQVSACYIKAADHVEVSIERANDSHVHHDLFVVDTKLGCLTGTGSLHSTLFLCWLHALTSHSLPDPLTVRTGTEEALRILRGSAVKSYPTLDLDSRDFLGQIAKLSPRREYYPRHICAMEQTTWNYDIPPLSQHDEFWPLAKSVYDSYETLGKLFQLGSKERMTALTSEMFAEAGRRRSSDLEDRARVRNAIFRLSGFGAEAHTTTKDKSYHPRDRKNTGSADCRAKVAQLARCVDTGGEHLLFTPSLNLTRTITGVNGDKFSGVCKTDLAFNLECFEPLSKSLKGRWCGLHRELAVESNKYRKIFFLSSLLYAERSDQDVVQALMALGSISAFSHTEMLPPSETEFDLTIRRDILSSILSTIVGDGAKPLEKCLEFSWARNSSELVRVFEARREREWMSKSKDMIRQFVAALVSQIGLSWTVAAPTNQPYNSYLDVGTIMPRVRARVEMARRSEEFHKYLNSLSGKLSSTDIMESSNLPAVPSTCRTIRASSRPGFISAMSLFSRPAPNFDRPRLELFSALCVEVQGSEQRHLHLSALVDELSGVGGLQGHQTSYIDELRRSMASPAVSKRKMAVPKDNLTIRPVLDQNLQHAREGYESISHSLGLALAASSIAHQICENAGFSPRISPIFFLKHLSKPLWTQFSRQWQRCLVNFALSVIYLQRAERLASYGHNLPERWSDLQRELSNPGNHDNPDWDPIKYPESLLLEIEQGIMIRPVQNEIASVMRSPPAEKNSVMQLNMGEGKSSVIVPIVAAALACEDRLVRVVVAKPQSSQMTHMLISRLGGLINRRIFYLPISRSVRLSESDVELLRDMIDTCKSEGGVLLVQPEHLLSFKLMGIDRSWAEKEESKDTLGSKIVELHQKFESASRDIVDESDENFSVKFELVYTMGSQEAVEMSPDRWILIQELLGLVETVVRRLMTSNTPESTRDIRGGLLFKDYGAGRVPVIRVLGEPAGRELIRTLATEVCRLGVRALPVQHQIAQTRRAVVNYLLLEEAPQEDVDMVGNADTGFFSNPTTNGALLLLRGLLGKGVLLFALGQKRFRVNYGLAPDRQPPTMLAVPYRAKDMPSLRSEFSHPDVVIVLTCLSYYYRGLSDAELYICLELLNNSDQADEEYGRWAAACPQLPPSFHHFSSINLDDRAQCESTVFPALRYVKSVADFYLARVVFPREMKQFPFKLSASGWDLARPKEQPMTGFSGTNDSKGVLPLSVRALDLQPHTNATVLSTLLREENMVLELGDGGGAQVSALTEEMLLSALTKSEKAMQVILDVGAQIIESSNFQMAKKLLNSAHTSGTDAVIFFNDEDELSVLTRNGMVDSFLTSPFAANTHRCLVFLDQAHTRGTDLKLPDCYRAAVTLGPGVTKDTLVQACMRMRKLGQGQSVTFIVSSEMQKRIRAIRNIKDGRPLTVPDVLAWAISEAWDEAARSVPLWAIQGERHLRQDEIWKRADKLGGFSPSMVEEYLEPEAMTLEQRYCPKPATNRDIDLVNGMTNLTLGAQHSLQNDNLTSQRAAINAKLIAFRDATDTAPSATLQEEQERELAPEIEEERHVSRPPPRQALPHNLHPDVRQFINTGHIVKNSPAFIRPFAAFSKTSAAPLFDAPLSAFPSDLLSTQDFARTVKEAGPAYCADAYQRGVQWVVTTNANCGAAMRMVIVSPWEASEVKRIITTAVQQHAQDGDLPPVTLHAYLPRSSLAFRSMEDLKTYTVSAVPAAEDWTAPSGLVMQLNLFAGQLYLRSYEEYVRLCRYLGLAYTENKGDEAVAQDGFVGKKGYPECEFESSPVAFLAEVYRKIRRDCVGIEKTHMGKILAGEILTERDFEGASEHLD